jgi:hypothetical protein
MVLPAIARERHGFVQPEPKNCTEVILGIVKKTREAVADFFLTIGRFFLNVFRFLFCIPQGNPRMRDFVDEPFQVLRARPLEIPRGEPELTDLPADLEALRAVLRGEGGVPQISNSMTPDHFSTLCEEYPIHVEIRKRIGENAEGQMEYGPVLQEVVVQESQLAQPAIEAVKQDVAQREGADQANLVEAVVIFPPERRRIADWAIIWANQRSPKVDPEHPYFQIVQAAFRDRNNIEGGNDSSADYTTYSPANQNYDLVPNRFSYLVYSLIGFQELDKNIALFRKLDNWSLVNNQNPAYDYATAVSKIYTYPKAFGGNEDVRHKLQNGLGAAWAAFEWARDNGQEHSYFTRCFLGAYCFDARVMAFQSFNLENMHPHFEDFNAAVVHGDTVETKVTRYFSAFKHEQIDLYIRERPLAGLTYERMKAELNAGVDAVHIQDFYADYCTLDRFRAYLDQNNQPIRVPTIDILGIAPRVAGIEFDLAKPFIQVANIALPPAQRVIGTWIAIQHPESGNWYKAQVHRVDPNRIDLDLRGDPITENEWSNILQMYALI